jgi:RNA polymerase sigma factor (sigma-70 family)
MTNPALSSVLHNLRRLGGTLDDARLTDPQLLERFVHERDEAAFATLVRRHGRLVLSACRRVLSDEADIEDTFQATFLVLLRKARTVRWQASIGNWLFGVAHRVAVQARANALRRRRREDEAASRRAEHQKSAELPWRDAIGLLHEELDRLPDAYRLPILLCCLDGKTRDEAAQALRCSVGSVKGRLERGRDLLRGRLLRRGLTLSGALLAALVDAPPASSALSSSLVRDTLQAAVTGRYRRSIAALIRGTAPSVLGGKLRLTVGALLMVSLLAVGAGQALAPRDAAPEPAASPAAKAESPKPDQAAKTPITIRGRVLDADGQPVPGARLFSPHVRQYPPRRKDDFTLVARGSTDGEGRFTVELARSEWGPLWFQTLVAAADGHGVDWADLPSDKPPTELTLRLPRSLPIEGRILNTEGKPVAGALVSVVSIQAMAGKQLDAFLAEWKQEWRNARGTKVLYLSLDKILGAVRTDAEGRFRIAGVGSDSVALLWAKGQGIAHGSMIVVNRAGFDPAALNRAVQAGVPESSRLPGQPPLLHGPKLDYIAVAPRLIEGTVRASDTGEPIAGVRVWSSIGSGFDDICSAVTDKDGRYRLTGLPKMKEVLLHAEDPDENSAWLQGGARVPDRKGFEPLQVDLTLARGVLVTGRVTDKATGEGVLSAIHFVPLRENTFFNKPGYNAFDVSRGGTQTDEKGRFRLVVIPGPGVLMAQAAGRMTDLGQRINTYKTAEFDARDRERVKVMSSGDMRYFAAAGGRTEGLDAGQAVKYLDAAPNSGPVTCDLQVDSGRTLTVHIQGPDGKPLSGAIAAGLTVSVPAGITLKGPTATVYALDPESPRPLMFVHRQRQLIGMLTVRGDEKEPPVVRLDRAGHVTGRLLDEVGQPITGAAVSLAINVSLAKSRSARSDAIRRLLGQINRDEPRTRTDKDGRFRLDCLLPGLEFSLHFHHENRSLFEQPNSKRWKVEPGQTLELGDLRVKPSP